MHYYVDGYNLMFRISTANNDISGQRQQLIEDLNSKAQFLNLNITVVFDSQYKLGNSERFHFQQLEIVYTDHGETADQRILEEIQSEKYPSSKITVVTSDKKLAWFARRCSAATESVEDFMSWVNKRCKNRVRQRRDGIVKPKQSKKTGISVTPSPRTSSLPPLPVLLVPKKVEKLVAIQAPLEHNEDFYLETFQARYAEIKEKTKKAPTEPQKRKTKPKRKKIEASPEDEAEKGMLEMDRWLKIFERKSKE